MKWQQLQQPSISNKLNSQLQSVQASRRCALLKQLKAIKYLLHQGIAVRGHTEIEGNLYQLLLMLANDSVDMKSGSMKVNTCHMRSSMNRSVL